MRKLSPVLLLALVTSCAHDAPERSSELPTWETFKAERYDAELDEYTFEGDIALDEAGLRAEYDHYVARSQDKWKEGDPAKLLVGFKNGQRVVWPKRSISYCIDEKSFGADAAKVRASAAQGGGAWTGQSSHYMVSISESGAAKCTLDDPAVDVVIVRHSFGKNSNILAKSFFPDAPRDQHYIRVAPGVEGSVHTLTHEFGHILGFRHEDNRWGANLDEVCHWEDSDWQPLTSADPDSIMLCSGGAERPTASDIRGLRCAYPSPAFAQENFANCLVPTLFYTGQLGANTNAMSWVMQDDILGSGQNDNNSINRPAGLTTFAMFAASSKNVSVCYNVWSAGGWQDEACDGNVAGVGQPIDVIRLRVASGPANCRIEYNTNLDTLGWQTVKRDNASSGAPRNNTPLLGIRVRLSPECF